jgi:dUTP pyrophosphatase
MRRFEKVERVKDIEMKLPERSTRNSAGYDFHAIEDIIVPPYKIGDNPFMIATGVKVKMLHNEFLMLVNRSSNPKKKKLVIPQSMGIIDADYYNNSDNEGEMFFAFYNLSNEPVEIKKDDKLGQRYIFKIFFDIR